MLQQTQLLSWKVYYVEIRWGLTRGNLGRFALVFGATQGRVVSSLRIMGSQNQKFGDPKKKMRKTESTPFIRESEDSKGCIYILFI